MSTERPANSTKKTQAAPPGDPGERRRAYMREYQRELRGSRKRVEILFETEDYERLQQAADDHGLKVSTFIRAAALGYLDERFVVPDPKRVAELELTLRRISDDLHRIARRSDGDADDHRGPSLELSQRVQETEDAVSFALRDPPGLLELLEQHVRENPAFADLVRARLDPQPQADQW